MLKEKYIVVIPARGGSKRIPRKNIKTLHGKPMIAWTIEHFTELGFETYVDTDDDEIKEISCAFGAKVPFLRDNFFDDHSPVSLATANFLTRLRSYSQTETTNVIQAMANCPLRDNQFTLDILHEFEKEKRSLISATSYAWLNPYWAHSKKNDGQWTPVFKEHHGQRSQDFAHSLCPTGSTWVSSVKNLILNQTFYAPGYDLFESNFLTSIDIDTMSDFKICEDFFSILDRK